MAPLLKWAFFFVFLTLLTVICPETRTGYSLLIRGKQLAQNLHFSAAEAKNEKNNIFSGAFGFECFFVLGVRGHRVL